MTGNVIALIGVVFSILSALAIIVYRGGQVVTEVRTALAELRVMIAELRAGMATLHDYPITVKRVEQLEDVHSTLASRVDTLWEKVFSLDKVRAVNEAVEKEKERRASRPDLSEFSKREAETKK